MTPGPHLGELERGVRAALGAGPAPPGQNLAAALVELTAACLDELRTGTPPPERVAALARWVEALQRGVDELSAQALLDRAQRLAECERGLLRLRAKPTTADLIDGACDELIRSLGFARTMLARVEDGLWVPWKANRSMLVEPWVADWIDGAIRLDEWVLETRLLRERRPALILSTAVPGVAPMVHAARVTSYVVAPIMPAGQVVGFFHADHGIGGRRCDTTDRDALWAFAAGFGQLYERALLVEQLDARRALVREALARAGAELDHLTDLAEAPPLVPGCVVGVLTARETEVLELVAAGARNGDIAARLAISLTTVKTHVRNIMLKLGVDNRSQVIAAYFNAGTPPRPAPSPANEG